MRVSKQGLTSSQFRRFRRRSEKSPSTTTGSCDPAADGSDAEERSIRGQVAAHDDPGDDELARRPSKSVRDRAEDPLGITVLYKPKTHYTADIIFVHGLGGSSLQTWAKDGDPNLSWPQRWLPAELEISTARILTFGYNAFFRRSTGGSASDILDFAKSLLFEMKYGKDNEAKDLGIGKVSISTERASESWLITILETNNFRCAFLGRSCVQTGM